MLQGAPLSSPFLIGPVPRIFFARTPRLWAAPRSPITRHGHLRQIFSWRWLALKQGPSNQGDTLSATVLPTPRARTPSPLSLSRPDNAAAAAPWSAPRAVLVACASRGAWSGRAALVPSCWFERGRPRRPPAREGALTATLLVGVCTGEGGGRRSR